MTDDERRAEGDADDTASAPNDEQAPPAGTPPPVAEATAEPRRLTRSRDDRVIAGVCGGLGEYLGVDPVLVRIAALVLVFAGGAGVVLYLIGWVAMPEAPVEPGTPEPARAGSAAVGEAVEKRGALVLGLAFVLLGAFFLVDEIWPDFLSWTYVWPIALIAIGLAIILRPRR